MRAERPPAGTPSQPASQRTADHLCHLRITVRGAVPCWASPAAIHQHARMCQASPQKQHAVPRAVPALPRLAPATATAPSAWQVHGIQTAKQ